MALDLKPGLLIEEDEDYYIFGNVFRGDLPRKGDLPRVAYRMSDRDLRLYVYLTNWRDKLRIEIYGEARIWKNVT